MVDVSPVIILIQTLATLIAMHLVYKFTTGSARLKLASAATLLVGVWCVQLFT